MSACTGCNERHRVCFACLKKYGTVDMMMWGPIRTCVDFVKLMEIFEESSSPA